ncbi:MAG: hypothetical protein EBU66_20870, partial [Bacteroidetes bacterium]|nr:hypothetical protein [Bacteroidota bacterium]
ENWDKCTKNYWNIAEQLYNAGKNKFRYKGNHVWEYNNSGEWKKDKNNKELSKYISNELYESLMSRVLYWQSINQNDDYEINYRIIMMLEIATILKNKNHLKDILKEAKEFFVVD